MELNSILVLHEFVLITVYQCNTPMGMSNGMITNQQISSSSHQHYAHKARLYGDSGWRAESDSDEWIQVDLQRTVYVSGLTTQGRNGGHVTDCVTRYKVLYSEEEEEWQYVLDAENEEKVGL